MIPPTLCTRQLAGHPALDYVELGDCTGTPVIALHGVTDSWRSFQPLLPHLNPQLRLFALSQRGHGDSERPAGGYRPRDFADDVLRLMDTIGLPRAVVVGHSMGGVNALRFAIDHPQRVLGLVLAGSVPAFGANAEVTAWWRSEIAGLADPIARTFARDFQLGTLAQPVPTAYLETVVDESLKVPARVWRACFDGFMTEDLRADLGRIDAPVLVVRGGRDTICTEADQRHLAAAIPGATMKTYEAAGHAMHWEEPQRFASDLSAFALGAAAAMSQRLEPVAA